ncbi:MAG TPA: tetratricopeptide repeat protein [Gemmataceae bacterium]|nr:tetratricopeptide repeat protein [Gemmataceae bacterium]
MARLLLLLAILIVSAGLIGPQASAAVHFYRGRSEMNRFRSEEALAHFEAALRVWPDDETSHIFASRAARRLGRFDLAEMHLLRCRELQSVPSLQLTLEWAYLRAAEGELLDVESYLYDQLRLHPELTPLIWEALIQGYSRVYRTTDALKCLNQWLERDGNNIQALVLLGNLHLDVHAFALAASDYEKAMALDSRRHDVRRSLAISLMNIGHYEDSLRHWEILHQSAGEDPDTLARMAQCHLRCNHVEATLALVKHILEIQPGFGPALRTRGQLELSEERPAEAEIWFRKAVEAMPYDYVSHYGLYESLRDQRKETEKLGQEEHMRQLLNRLERIGEITSHEIALHPRDANLQLELAKLFLSVGRPEDGQFWLHNALKLDPQLRDAYLELAEFYHQQGNQAQEDAYRAQANALPEKESKGK